MRKTAAFNAREQRVVELTLIGRTATQIGAALNIDDETVRRTQRRPHIAQLIDESSRDVEESLRRRMIDSALEATEQLEVMSGAEIDEDDHGAGIRLGAARVRYDTGAKILMTSMRLQAKAERQTAAEKAQAVRDALDAVKAQIDEESDQLAEESDEEPPSEP